MLHSDDGFQLHSYLCAMDCYLIGHSILHLATVGIGQMQPAFFFLFCFFFSFFSLSYLIFVSPSFSFSFLSLLLMQTFRPVNVSLLLLVLLSLFPSPLDSMQVHCRLIQAHNSMTGVVVLNQQLQSTTCDLNCDWMTHCATIVHTMQKKCTMNMQRNSIRCQLICLLLARSLACYSSSYSSLFSYCR